MSESLRVLIAYHSDYGNTEKIAGAISRGMKTANPDLSVRVQNVAETTPDDLISVDVILLGTPVHMGGMAWQVKKFIDDTAGLWMENALQGKVGGIFATGGGFGNAGGGVELTLASLYANFLEHGMIVVGFPKTALGYAEGGLHWGLYARTASHEGMPAGVTDAQLIAARSYGAHVVEVAEKILGN